MTESSNPNTTINILPANVPAPNAAQRCLVVAQKLSGGSATAQQLYTDVAYADIAGLAGAGSMGEDAVDAYRDVNEVTPIDMIFLDDPTGNPGVAEILWDGTATENGTLTITVASERNGQAAVSISKDDTSDDVATAVTAAFTSLTKCVAGVTTDGVTTDQNNITYRHDGTEGNFFAVRVEGSVAGITYTITGATGGSGVATVPDIAAIVGSQRYQKVIGPGTLGTDWMTDLLDARFNTTNRILDGVGIVTLADTKSNHVTALNLLNSQSLCYQCEGVESQSDYKGPSMMETLFARSAMVAAVSNLRLSDGENISGYVNAVNGPSDATGGPALASLPYFNTPLPLPVMKAGYGFTDTEVEEIKTAGGFVAGNNTAGNQVILDEVTTTYKTDSAGNDDPSFKYLNYVETASQAREYMFNNVKKDCAQSRLTTGDLVPNRNINNEQSMRAKFVRYYGVLAGPDYVLTQAGEDALVFFKGNLTITVDLVTGLVTANMKTPIVTQLRTIIANMQLAFSLS